MKITTKRRKGCYHRHLLHGLPNASFSNCLEQELEDIGISSAAFEANKRFLMQWLQSVKENGLFEEQSLPHSSDSLPSWSAASSTSPDVYCETVVPGLPSPLGHTPERSLSWQFRRHAQKTF
jgi:hypothetical protein